MILYRVMNPHRLKAYILLLIVAVIWGIAGPVIKFTLVGISPFLFLAYRFGLSSIIAFLLFFLGVSKIPKNKIVLGETVLYGFLTSTVALSLLFAGLDKTTVLDMSLITMAGPLLIAIAGTLFLNERITKREKTGIGLALFGVSVIALEPLFSQNTKFSGFSGNLLIILYLLVNVVSVIMAKKLLKKGVSPLTMTNISFVIGFLTILPFAIMQKGSVESLIIIKNLDLARHLGVIYMALISGNLAYFLWVKAQKTIEVGEAALFAYLYPLFAAPLAVFWLGEKITVIFIIGAMIITIGVSIAEAKKKRYN